MLESLRDYFRIGPEQMQQEIEQMLAQTKDILASKGIQYSGLKRVLVPDPKRREVALVFDTLKVEENWYALPIFSALIPLLSKESKHSVLAGDYIGSNHLQDVLQNAFNESVNLIRNVKWQSSDQFYIIYLNNLTDKMINTIHDGLSEFRPYAGLANMKFASRFKLFLSTMLVNVCIKHNDIILMGHEDDLDNEEDVNITGYPWETFGYKSRSLQEMYFGVLLSYKIERPVIQGFESDLEFSINAVNPQPLPISDLEICVRESKLDYLSKKKAGTLKRIGLLGEDLSQLQDIIYEKISSSYIYNMQYLPEHKTTKFNINLEILPSGNLPPQRIVVALKYLPADRKLELITLY